jgi:shikimate 5-dehydrogenase
LGGAQPSAMTYLVKCGALTVVARTAVDAQKLVEQLQRDDIVKVTDLNHREVDLKAILSDKRMTE